jgi:hypothetical protein
MPVFASFYLILAVLCIVHAYQTGQERFWIFVVLFFPFIGSLAYIGAVFVPMALSSSGTQKSLRTLRDSVNPQRYLEAAERQLAMARTPENLFLYGEALVDLNRFEDADVIMRELGQNPVYAEFPKFLLLCAKIDIYLHRFQEALTTLDRYREFSRSKLQGPALVLYSYAYEGLNDFDSAEAVFKETLDRIGGEELRYHYGEFLMRRGRRAEARNIFHQVVTRSEQMSRHYRSQEGQWIKKARQQLKLIPA